MRNTKRGFTLIELLVVIAIIGILSAIVLASLSTARNKANDAKVQSQIASIRSAAEIYYSTNSSYAGICTVASTDTSGLYPLLQAASYPGNTAPTCSVSGTGSSWSVYKALSTSGAYACVDSTGASKTYTTGFTAPTSGAACP